METDLPSPQARADQIGRADVERRLRQTMSEGALSHGWIIAGPSGAGKATLAYRIARGLLDPSALSGDGTFVVPETARVFRLVAAGAHPDLFIAQREWDQRKSKYQSEITVETVRKLTMFLNRTASEGGARVAIVDTADDMNRNAANALLKALEEPPSKTLLLLLSATPGRLLATIRSRCRRLDLPPLDKAEIEALLAARGLGSDDAATIAAAARGRPGYALRLASGDGTQAVRLSFEFLDAVSRGADLSKFVKAVSGKTADDRWAIFTETLTDRLSQMARGAAGGAPHDAFANASPAAFVSAWEAVVRLISRGEALNLDRAQLVHAMAYDLRAALCDKTAGRRNAR